MREMIELFRRPVLQRDQRHTRLLAEIAYLEARLIAVGQTGDCAYEKSLARSYRELLSQRREELAAARRDEATRDATSYAGTFLAQSARYLLLSRETL